MPAAPQGWPAPGISTPAEGLTDLPSEPRLTYGSWRITGIFDGGEGRQLFPGGRTPLPDPAGGQPDDPEVGGFAGATAFCARGSAGPPDGCGHTAAGVRRAAAESAGRGQKGAAGAGRPEARGALAGRE